MTPALPLGHEPFGRELRVERLEAEWRFRVIYERNALVSMEMSFFALPSKQGPVQGRFKPTHDSAELVAGLPISLSASIRKYDIVSTRLKFERWLPQH
jgi:hypothetical protein